jgi:hypothetical protein
MKREEKYPPQEMEGTRGKKRRKAILLTARMLAGQSYYRLKITCFHKIYRARKKISNCLGPGKREKEGKVIDC